MKLYKAKELAKILDVHTQTIYRLGNQGKIRSVKVGRLVRFYMPAERGRYGEDNTKTASS